MKSTLQNSLVLLFFVSSAQLFAQTNTDKIKVKITQEINGEKKTFEGEYDSEEQMKSDPNYQEFVGTPKNFMFQFDDEDFSFSNGKPGNGFFFLSPDGEEGPAMFQLDSTMDFHWNGMEEMKAQLEELQINHLFMPVPPGVPGFSWFFSDSLGDKSLNGSANSFGFSSGNQKQIHIIGNVEIKNIEGNEFGKKGTVAKNEQLQLDNLSFYPNPSDGKFTIRFKVPQQGELEIKIYNVDGREVFSRFFDQFGGTYSESVDLTGQVNGIYLMEIRLDKSRLTRKIVIGK